MSRAQVAFSWVGGFLVLVGFALHMAGLLPMVLREISSNGPAAGVLAGHVAIAVAGIMVIARLQAMVRSDADGDPPLRLMRASMTLAFASCVEIAFKIVERIYYFAARILIDHGIDLWQSYPAVWILGLCLALSMLLHLTAYWRWQGCHGRALQRRMTIDAATVVAVWLATLWLTW